MLALRAGARWGFVLLMSQESIPAAQDDCHLREGVSAQADRSSEDDPVRVCVAIENERSPVLRQIKEILERAFEGEIDEAHTKSLIEDVLLTSRLDAAYADTQQYRDGDMADRNG